MKKNNLGLNLVLILSTLILLFVVVKNFGVYKDYILGLIAQDGRTTETQTATADYRFIFEKAELTVNKKETAKDVELTLSLNPKNLSLAGLDLIVAHNPQKLQNLKLNISPSCSKKIELPQNYQQTSSTGLANLNLNQFTVLTSNLKGITGKLNNCMILSATKSEQGSDLAAADLQIIDSFSSNFSLADSDKSVKDLVKDWQTKAVVTDTSSFLAIDVIWKQD